MKKQTNSDNFMKQVLDVNPKERKNSMKRIIKFRAWDGEHLIYDWTEIETSLSLMQFTGLLDKNGKEIYEGDIVTFIGYRNLVVTWQPKGCHAGWFGVGNTRPFPPLGLYSRKEPNTIEVIGNIHEHPHLLPHPDERA